MHLIEKYSLSCGLRIKKPVVFEKYFPLPTENYITLHSQTKDAKTYNHWQEVIDLIGPTLQKLGISIIHIGHQNDRPLNNIINILGQTTINQVAYILRHSQCHLGVDSFPTHIASTYDIPIVCLYSNNHVNCVKPYFGDSSKHFLLEPNRNGDKPSFSLSEFPKTINSIPPEKIADSVFKALNLPNRAAIKTLYFGPLYENFMVEVVPRGYYFNKQIGVDAFIVRMDIEFNEQCLIEQLKICPCNIVTDRPVNLDIIRAFRKQIREIIYLIREHHKPQFIRDLSNLGVRYQLLSELPEDEFQKIKIHYMEYGHIGNRPVKIPDALKGIDTSRVFYRSKKYILSENKIYTSKASLDNGISIPNFAENISSVVAIKKRNELWVESDHFYFFERLDIPKNP